MCVDVLLTYLQSPYNTLDTHVLLPLSYYADESDDDVNLIGGEDTEGPYTPDSSKARWTADLTAPNTQPLPRYGGGGNPHRLMRRRELSLPALTSKHMDSMLREDPYTQGLASTFETGANIVKAVMGAAMFAIP